MTVVHWTWLGSGLVNKQIISFMSCNGKKRQYSLSYLSMYSQYLECREEELNELHHLLDTNHKAVTKWKTDVVATAKVNSLFVGG